MSRHKCPSCGNKIRFMSLLFIVPAKPFATCQLCGAKITRTDISLMTTYGLAAVLIYLLLKQVLEPFSSALIVILAFLLYDYYRLQLRVYTESELANFAKINNLPNWAGKVLGVVAFFAGILIFATGIIFMTSIDTIQNIENIAISFLLNGVGLFSVIYGYKLFSRR